MVPLIAMARTGVTSSFISHAYHTAAAVDRSALDTNYSVRLRLHAAVHQRNWRRWSTNCDIYRDKFSPTGKLAPFPKLDLWGSSFQGNGWDGIWDRTAWKGVGWEGKRRGNE